MKYFIASRWRNADSVKVLSEGLKQKGHQAYSFLDNGSNLMTGGSVAEGLKGFGDAVSNWEHDPNIKKIFDTEMDGLKDSEIVVLLEPGGHSSLLEAGIGYGMGKEVIIIGPVAQPEVFYLICRRIYSNLDAFLTDLQPATPPAPAA